MKNYKENLILIIGMVIILGTHLVSCEKIPLPPPVVEPEELAPTLELTVTPKGIIPYGEKNVVLGWTTTNATQVRVNDQRQTAVKTGTHTITNRLFKDTTFYVKAINIKEVAEKEKKIEVGDWTTSTFGLVSYYPWKYKAARVTRDGVILSTLPLDEEILSWVFYYHRDGKKTQTIDPNRTEPWYLKNDSTIVTNGVARKLQVDQDEMVISYETRFNGEPAWFNMIFEHASDTPTDPE